MTSGRWTSAEKLLHINALELLAAFYALRSLASNLRKGTVVIQMDNEVAVACIRRMGSNSSPTLNSIARDLWEWCLARQVTPIPEYLPGIMNTIADYQSRHHSDSSDWMLDRSVFQMLQQIWPVNCDLFASRTNAQLPMYVSWRPDPYARWTDAFSIDWSLVQGYAFPPICMIGKCLSRVLQQGVPSLVLITPLWQGQAWFPAALRLSCDFPQVLPAWPTLLTCPDQEVHPLVETQRLILVAWKLSGRRSLTEVFRRRLPNFCWHRGVPALSESTSPPGISGFLGVTEGVSIPWMPL